MEQYKHGIETNRNAKIAESIESLEQNVQVAIGTAPINLLEDPESAVNTLLVVRKSDEVSSLLGSSSDYQSYTLMQTKYNSFKVFGCAPVVMINVLDPNNSKHVTAVASAELVVTGTQATVDTEGVLLSTLKLSSGSTTLTADADYVAEFDDNGYVSIALTDDGAKKVTGKLTASYTKLNPAGVTAKDIIGGIDENGKRTGIELIEELYQRTGLVRGILSAPGYSKNESVAAALAAKAEPNRGSHASIAVVDIDAEKVTTKEAVATEKQNVTGYSEWTAACWPEVIVGGEQMYYSSNVAALLQYLCISNDGFPQSPDNKDNYIEGTVLHDGSEIFLTEDEANDYLLGQGIVTAIYMGGWKCWGSNTTAYPKEKDNPLKRFIKNAMTCNYIENVFKTNYRDKIGKDASYKLIDSIVSNFNYFLNTYVPDKFAGAEVIFDKADNPASSLQQGKIIFRTRYADFTPLEWMENTFTWDSDVLEAALSGEDES